MARQPIPVSPYDDMIVEFHRGLHVEGRLRKVGVDRAGVLDYSAPVSTVYEYAQGLIGSLVCGRPMFIVLARASLFFGPGTSLELQRYVASVLGILYE